MEKHTKKVMAIMKLFTSFGLINKKVRAERERETETQRHREKLDVLLLYHCVQDS